MLYSLVASTLLFGGDLDTPELPAPRTVVVEPAMPVSMPIPTGYYRESRYAVWDNYGVDRHGQFRALVINAPCGAYYRYNGKPYGLMPVNQLNVMPRMVD